jgi:hypothetical protein
MARIFTACPVTAQAIDTGIDIEESYISRLPSFVGKIFCPHCSSEHEWSKDTAQIVDGDNPKT